MAFEETDFDRKFAVLEGLRKEHNYRAIWSIYETCDQMSEVRFPGTITIMYDDHWGKEVEPITLTDATWMDLWAAGDKLIRDSRDQHHIYIEGFRRRKNHTYTMITGS